MIGGYLFFFFWWTTWWFICGLSQERDGRSRAFVLRIKSAALHWQKTFQNNPLWDERGRPGEWRKGACVCRHMLLFPLSAWNLIIPPPLPRQLKLTCDDTGEGAAHGHRRVRGGRPAKGRHDRRRAAERSEGGRVAVVAVVVRLGDWRVTHQGGVGPIVSEMGVDRRCIWVLGPVLQRWSLVLFTSDTTHCQAYMGRHCRWMGCHGD